MHLYTISIMLVTVMSKTGFQPELEFLNYLPYLIGLSFHGDIHLSDEGGWLESDIVPSPTLGVLGSGRDSWLISRGSFLLDFGGVVLYTGNCIFHDTLNHNNNFLITDSLFKSLLLQCTFILGQWNVVFLEFSHQLNLFLFLLRYAHFLEFILL